MKKIAIFSFALLFAAGCGKVHDEYYPRVDETGGAAEVPVKPKTFWEEAADKTTGSLIDNFWRANKNSDTERFWHFSTDNADSDPGNAYWGQAHAGDVLTDAYLRTGEQKYLDLIEKWYIGVPLYNYHTYQGDNRTWVNPFVDDMEWQAIALIRMYEATGQEKFLNTAIYLFDNHIFTADTWGRAPGNGGGILWSYSQEYSANACSNGPAVVIAGKLAAILGAETPQGQKYTADAEQIYGWLRTKLYNSSTGAVADNIKNGKVSGGALTYNQGTFLGGAHLLYKLTGNITYLADAVKAADYYVARQTVLPNEGDGDNSLFKGIFVRYFVQLAGEPDLDKSARTRFFNYLNMNAVTAWEKGLNAEDILFGPGWDTVPGSVTDFGSMVSGCTLIEAMNVLQEVR